MIMYLAERARFDTACPTPIDPWEVIVAFKSKDDAKEYIKNHCETTCNNGWAGWRSRIGIFEQEIRTYYKVRSVPVMENLKGGK